MDFFDHQDRARKQTGRLIFLFLGGVLGISALTYGLVLILLMAMSGTDQGASTPGQPTPALPYFSALFWTLACVLGLVGGSSLFKIAQLRAGGGAMVAESLGGRRLEPDTRDPLERQVLNVVEEMAIASGLPVPPVYLMDQERGINAFAAGYTPESAVIGVTRGAAEHFSRDELQGVIAHEFSHILNGDMRLNIRLIGVIFGIVALTVLGRILLRSAIYAPARRSSNDKGGGQIALLAAGVGFLVIGSVGVLFGRLIQAAISRQREFLADASAVQFTRNPDGIANALRRIGGIDAGSQIESPHAAETAHLFFGNATASLSGLMATHPPLPERIRRIDPRGITDGAPRRHQRAATSSQRPTPASGGAASVAGFSALAGTATPAARPTDEIGQLEPVHLARAQQLLADLPEGVRDAAHQSESAQALVLTLLISPDATVQARQWSWLEAQAPANLVTQMRHLAPAVLTLDRPSKLPAADLAIPALANLATRDYQQLKQRMEGLIQADGRLDLFEQILQRIIDRHLGARLGAFSPPPVRHRRIEPLFPAVREVLSALAWGGLAERESAGEAQAAYAAGATHLGLPLDRHPLLAAGELGGRRLNGALAELEQATPTLQRSVAQACEATVLADGQVRPQEKELLRLVLESIGVPMPPLQA